MRQSLYSCLSAMSHWISVLCSDTWRGLESTIHSHHPFHACCAEGPISLFLGSRTDTSQLVSIPKALLQDQPQGGATSQLAPPAEGGSKPLLDDDSVQRLAAFDCAAPIHDAVVFQDPPGRARCMRSCCAICSTPHRCICLGCARLTLAG